MRFRELYSFLILRAPFSIDYVRKRIGDYSMRMFIADNN
jgi:hypothetical protein